MIGYGSPPLTLPPTLNHPQTTKPTLRALATRPPKKTQHNLRDPSCSDRYQIGWRATRLCRPITQKAPCWPRRNHDPAHLGPPIPEEPAPLDHEESAPE